jgi:methylated-DNA-protein-cysteine methyltransferase-like protein
MTEYSQKTTNFFDDVYEVVRLIPQGRVSSYGAIAKYIGSGGSARMVGWAMNACTGRDDVPAHRVVNRAGVELKGDQIIGFNEIHWDPAQELAL